MDEEKYLCFDDRLLPPIGINPWREDIFDNSNSKFLKGKLNVKGPFIVDKKIEDYGIFARARVYSGEVGGNMFFGDALAFNNELLFKGNIEITKGYQTLLENNIFYMNRNIDEFNKENPLEYLVFENAKTDKEKIERIDLIVKGYEKEQERSLGTMKGLIQMAKNIRREHGRRRY